MDLIDQVKKWWLENKAKYSQEGPFPNEVHPDYSSYQERFSRTPGVVVSQGNLPEGVAAQYTPDKIILSTPNSSSNVISHEAAHSLYDQAGLKNYMSQLNAQVPHYVRTLINSSPIYQQEMKRDPTTLSDEALGFSMNSPGEDDERYMNYAASKISDPALKNRLVQLFQHAKQMNLIRQKQLYGK